MATKKLTASFFAGACLFFLLAIPGGPAHAQLVDKDVIITPVGDGSFTLDITAPSADDCTFTGSSATSYISFGVTGGGGTFWTTPTTTQTTYSYQAYPVANTDFGALQAQCAPSDITDTYLLNPVTFDIMQIGFPLFHTGPLGIATPEPVDGYGWASFNGALDDSCAGTHCMEVRSNGADSQGWMRFDNVTAAPTMTLVLPPPGACLDENVSVYVMNGAISGTGDGLSGSCSVPYSNCGRTGDGGPINRGTLVSDIINYPSSCGPTDDPVIVTLTLDATAQSDFNTYHTIGLYAYPSPNNGLVDFDGANFAAWQPTLAAAPVAPHNDFTLTAATLNLYFTANTTTQPGCENTNVFYGAICNALRFLFVPSSAALTQYSTAVDNLNSRVPFGWWIQGRTIINGLDENNNTTTTAFTFIVPTGEGTGTTTVMLFRPSEVESAIPTSTRELVHGVVGVALWGVFFWWLVFLALNHNRL